MKTLWYNFFVQIIPKFWKNSQCTYIKLKHSLRNKMITVVFSHVLNPTPSGFELLPPKSGRSPVYPKIMFCSTVRRDTVSAGVVPGGVRRLFRSTGLFSLVVILLRCCDVPFPSSRRNGYIFKSNVSILNPAGQFFAELCLSHRTFVMICVSTGCTKEGQRNQIILATSSGEATHDEPTRRTRMRSTYSPPWCCPMMIIISEMCIKFYVF